MEQLNKARKEIAINSFLDSVQCVDFVDGISDPESWRTSEPEYEVKDVKLLTDRFGRTVLRLTIH